jgi:8-oxo-dGTP pyrophosphatase MutT (NUDIX family)
MESSIITAVGIWFYSVDTQRYLYLVRNDPKHPNCWGLPGGKVEPGETLISGIVRECCEELGSMPDYLKLVPLEKFTTADSGFEYHTFFCSVATEFVPKLNDEHNGWAWINAGVWPKPMHPGLWSTVNFDAVRDKIQTMEQSVATDYTSQ